MILGATICKYGVTIARTIAGLLMYILAQDGPDDTCAEGGHTQRAAMLCLGSRCAPVASPAPTSPRPPGRLVARAVSISWLCALLGGGLSVAQLQTDVMIHVGFFPLAQSLFPPSPEESPFAFFSAQAFNF